MKNKLIVFITSLSYFAAAKGAFAAMNPCEGAQGISAVLCGFTGENMGSVIGGIINAIFVIAIIAALGYLVYGGLKWILSEGDKSKVADARGHIMAAIIGLIIVFLSYFVITLILQIFGLSLQDLKIDPIVAK